MWPIFTEIFHSVINYNALHPNSPWKPIFKIYKKYNFEISKKV